MDLREFVAESLKQIIDGVKEAQNHAGQNGAKVAPMMHRRGSAGNAQRIDYVPEGGGKCQNIVFDVAVTAQETSEQEGKAGIRIPYFDFGGKMAAGQENGTVSRIKFDVPIVLPTQKIA
ncbi:hypothetical protein ACR42D_10585 [Desulfovibrio caledoniensis]